MVLEILQPILQVVVDNVTTSPPPIVTVAPTTLELFDSLLSNIYLLIAAVGAILGGPLGIFIFKNLQNGKEIQATALTTAALFEKLASDNSQTRAILKILLTLTPEEGKKYLESPEVRNILSGTSTAVGAIKDEINTISKGMPQGARAMMQKVASNIDSENAATNTNTT